MMCGKITKLARKAKMILVLDTGNTNIVLGVYDQGKLIYHWRMETYRHKTEDEYANASKIVIYSCRFIF